MRYTIDYLWEDLEQGLVETLVRQSFITRLIANVFSFLESI